MKAGQEFLKQDLSECVPKETPSPEACLEAIAPAYTLNVAGAESAGKKKYIYIKDGMPVLNQQGSKLDSNCTLT